MSALGQQRKLYPRSFERLLPGSKESFVHVPGGRLSTATCGHSVPIRPVAIAAQRQVAISRRDEANLYSARKIPVITTARITIKVMPPGIAE